MHDEIVKYPTAKLAKEKGYPQASTKIMQPYYNYKGELNADCTDYIRALLDNKKGLNTNDDLEKVSNIRAMSQSLLQKWLREVHNVNIIPPLYYRNDGYACNLITFPYTIFYVTYEDALEDELYKQLEKL